MLAAQFLNVVLEENDKTDTGIHDFSGHEYNNAEYNNAEYSGASSYSGNENYGGSGSHSSQESYSKDRGSYGRTYSRKSYTVREGYYAKEPSGKVNGDSESNNNTIYEMISQLDIKAQLAKILLSECTIEPSEIARKREKPVLSFEANVTPIYDTPPPKKRKPNDELSILNSVEAVYSDGEGDGDDSPTVPCPVCNRSFSRNCSLALHMKSHEPIEDNIKRYQCSLCPRSYSQKSVLKKHQAECSAMHGVALPHPHQEPLEDNSVRRFQCQLCPRSYSQKSVLKKHLAVHTGLRERCNLCGSGFSQRSSLVRHAKRIHGGMLNNAVTPSNPSTPSTSGLSAHHSTPILTTALSGVTHPTLGTPLIVGIPLNQLNKYAGTPLASGLVVKSPAQLNSLVNMTKIANAMALAKGNPGIVGNNANIITLNKVNSSLVPHSLKLSLANAKALASMKPPSNPEPMPSTSTAVPN